MFTSDFARYMKYSIIALLLSLYFTVNTTQGQSLYMKGSVIDSINHTPLIGATIQLKEINGNHQYGAITDN